MRWHQVLTVFVLILSLGLVSAGFGYNSISLPKLSPTPPTLSGNLTNFTSLEDTPASYSGSADFCLVVNAGENGVDYISCPSGSGDNATWNEVLARTIFAVLGYGDDWNKTYADTLYAMLGYGDDWNKTYADTLYQPLEDQRLSTPNNVSFNNVNVSNNFTIESLTTSGVVKNDANGMLSGGNVLGFSDLHPSVQTLQRMFNGIITEPINGTVTSDGTDISFNLEKAGGGDLLLKFDDGFHTIDTTPKINITITAGSDSSPQINYIYIPSATDILTNSTTGFPNTEHTPIATVIVQSASTVQTNGALKVHIWTDHMSQDNGQGHLSDMNLWIRNQHSTWLSGGAQTLTITSNGGSPDNVDFATTSGLALQLHDHTFPAFDTSTGSDIHIVNNFTNAYGTIDDLNDILTDSTGASLKGRYFNVVIWISVSEDIGDSHTFVNIPSGSYNKEGDAIADVSGLTNFNIPPDFKGASILISKLTLRHQAASGGTWTSILETDLRETIPGVVAGGGTTAITTEFSDNTFKLFDETDVSKLLQFQLNGITTATTRTLTIPDKSGTISLISDVFDNTNVCYLNVSQTFTEDQVIPGLNVTNNLTVFGRTCFRWDAGECKSYIEDNGTTLIIRRY